MSVVGRALPFRRRIARKYYRSERFRGGARENSFYYSLGFSIALILYIAPRYPWEYCRADQQSWARQVSRYCSSFEDSLNNKDTHYASTQWVSFSKILTVQIAIGYPLTLAYLPASFSAPASRALASVLRPILLPPRSRVSSARSNSNSDTAPPSMLSEVSSVFRS